MEKICRRNILIQVVVMSCADSFFPCFGSILTLQNDLQNGFLSGMCLLSLLFFCLEI